MNNALTINYPLRFVAFDSYFHGLCKIQHKYLRKRHIRVDMCILNVHEKNATFNKNWKKTFQTIANFQIKIKFSNIDMIIIVNAFHAHS